MSGPLAHALVFVPVALVVACAMELWADLLHGKIWHGILWVIHRTHHRKNTGRWETNDFLSVLHAPIAIVLILYGCRGQEGVLREILFGVGIGMTLFGVSYLVVHDGLVHGRLPVKGLARFAYLRDVVAAHRFHHTKNGAPYGLFRGPFHAAYKASLIAASEQEATARQGASVDDARNGHIVKG